MADQCDIAECQAWLQKLADEARSTVRHSIKILAENTPPDTFIGRKTHDPFPQEQNRYGEETDRGTQLNTPAKRARARLRRLSGKLRQIKLEMVKSDSSPAPQNVDTKD
ncbi:hypothetical protein AB7M49_007829 [Bradyrhizobium elkanii]